MAQISKGGKEVAMKEIREPAVAGAFYPDKPEVLSKDVTGYLEKVKKEKVEGEIVALVSPHAGRGRPQPSGSF
jgi:predicted class III extradiol MEMO1 family dioxygenase